MPTAKTSGQMGAARLLAFFFLYFLLFTSALFRPFYLFNPNSNSGVSDSSSYIQMHDLDFSVSPIHRYRIGIPLLARVVSIASSKADVLTQGDQIDNSTSPQKRFSFLVVNCLLLSLAATLTLITAQQLTEQSYLFLCFPVAIAYLTPAIITIASSPMVDLGVVLGCSAYPLLLRQKDLIAFPVFSSILMALNERSIAYTPIVLLQKNRKLFIRLITFLAAVLLCLATHALIKMQVDTIYSIQLSESEEGLGVIKTFLHHLGNILSTIYHFTMHPKVLLRHFLFDIGYLSIASIAALAIMGRGKKDHNNPIKANAKEISQQAIFVVAISIVLFMMSGDFTRMVLAVTPYSSLSTALAISFLVTSKQS